MFCNKRIVWQSTVIISFKERVKETTIVENVEQLEITLILFEMFILKNDEIQSNCNCEINKLIFTVLNIKIVMVKSQKPGILYSLLRTQTFYFIITFKLTTRFLSREFRSKAFLELCFY